MAVDNVTNGRLQELSGSDFEISDGQPDIRGWDVRDDSGKKVGTVKELLFDETSRKVRYIILHLKDNDYNLEARKVLVPIGIANLHESDDDVILPGVTATQLELLPEYDKDSLNQDSEYKIRDVFAGAGGVALASTAPISTSGVDETDVFYNHDHFNENNLYKNRVAGASQTIPVIQEELQVGKREVETGGIRLKSRIIETPVEESINLREEKVSVVRTPVDRRADSADIKEGSIELTETAEVPVVSKQARVVEEISLNKDVTEKEKTISDTVRNTEVDIERTGKDDVSKESGIL